MLAKIPDSAPVRVQNGDLIGYNGSEFVLLNPRPTRDGLPRIPNHLQNASILVSCTIEEGQPVNFFGGGTNVLHHHARLATLRNIGGEWFYKPQGERDSRLKLLKPDTFMEAGHR